MQVKSLLTSALFFALSMPSVLAGRGRVSFYEDRPSKSQPGSCGDEPEYLVDYYIALNSDQYEKGLCGRCIKIMYNNKYLVGRLVDRCPGCGYGGLDISPSMFRHFEDEDTGIFTADWEYVSCDNYGKKGSCSGSDCGMSSSNKSKTTTTTTKSKTTTTTVTQKQTTTSVASKPTSTNANVKPNATTTGNANTTPTATSAAATSATTTPNSTATANATTTNVNSTNSSPSNIGNTNGQQNNTNVDNDNGNSGNGVTEVIGIEENADKEEPSSNIVLPLTGALMVTGAAGVGLLYLAKSKREGVQELKQKFPEAFKNIKRSLTNGSSIRRKVTRTYNKKKPHLPTSTNDIVETNNVNKIETTNPNEMDISETRINVN